MKSWIEVSAGALERNLRAAQASAGPDIEVLGVIKADAYGHGAELVAPVLVRAGARWLGVGDVEEGVRVRAALQTAGLGEAEGGTSTHVLVMCGMEPEDAVGMVETELTPVIWMAEHVQALESAAAAASIGGRTVRVPVHVEVDSGMARQGAAPGPELAAVMEALAAAPHVRCEGVFSHLGSSEVVRSVRTAMQCTRFDQAVEQMAFRLLPEYVHLGNSSAIDEGWTLPWTRERARKSGAAALVRPGLALYGYVLELDSEGEAAGTGYAVVAGAGEPMPGRLEPKLEPAATWKTRVVGLRDLAKGMPVGYGATFAAPGPMRLALLQVGYADGFRREASSGVGDGWVMIAGERAAVVGRVSMNLTVVDVTGLLVEMGDEVVLLGPGVTAADHARWCGTIPYEILCGMRGHRRLV